ncbi:MAG: hypothetical protein M9929_12825 [Burkholderiaceae bacterium]|nr:hypothetical protein [Burkholderiaceae bacterium]MCO5111705.1 hypothetical protein [Burkholderiaceae bacterium]
MPAISDLLQAPLLQRQHRIWGLWGTGRGYGSEGCRQVGRRADTSMEQPCTGVNEGLP